MRKKILFFPVESGLAHITRSLAIAEELKKRRHEVIFAITPNKQTFIKKSGIRTVDLPECLSETDFVTNINKLKDKVFIANLVKEDLKVLNTIKPDAVVVDFRPPSTAAAVLYNRPAFFLTGSGGLPFGCHIPNPQLPNFLFSLIESLLQKAVWRAKFQFLEPVLTVAQQYDNTITFDSFYQKMIYIVPEISTYLPRVAREISIFYTGPIIWPGFERYQPRWLDTLKPSGKTIYLTFGGTGFDKEKLINTAVELTKIGYTVVVSTGTIAEVSDFPQMENLFVEKYVSGNEIVKKVDLVVCHGGYGTLIQAVLAGKPTVSIPFNPDQLLHSLRFRELGLGECLFSFDFSILFGINWQRLMDLGKRISTKQIVIAIEQVLARKEIYQQAIDRFRQQFSDIPGHIVAADVIENQLRA